MIGTRRRRRRWPWILLGAVAVLVLGAYATYRVLEERHRARPVSVEQAKREFKPRDRATPAGALRPRQGIYSFEGTGTEDISFPPITQRQGPSIPGIITDTGGGCWELRIDYNSNHYGVTTYCPSGGALTTPRDVTFSRQFVGVTTVDSTQTTVCDPAVVVIGADPQPGDTWPRRCTSTNTSVSGQLDQIGTTTFVGREAMTIGGEEVEALHVRTTSEFGGVQSGTATSEWWFEATSALPLKNERLIEVKTPSIIGDVTYTETGSFRLTSLTPKE